MRLQGQTCRIAAATMLLAGLLKPASADTIDFDSEGYTGPSIFAAAGPAQTLTIISSTNDVTITGGVILTSETNLPADQSSVYATSVFGSGLTNPIAITFSSPITNFALDVYNGLTTNITYKLSDNAGNSTALTLVPNLSGGQARFGFPAAGNVITISSISAPTSTWDFSIDNIAFNFTPPPPPLTPLQKAIADGLSAAFGILSDELAIASIIADGPKKLLVNAAIFLAQKAAEAFDFETIAATIDIGAQLKSITDAILNFAETVKSPQAFALGVLSTYAGLDAKLLAAIAKDPPDPNFTKVAPPPDLTTALPSELAELPNFGILSTTVSDKQTCASFWDAELTANQRYQGAALAGDLASEELQLNAFNTFRADAIGCARTLSNDLSLLEATLPTLDLTAFTDAVSDIAGAIAGQCGEPLPPELQTALGLTGATSPQISSLVCQAAAGFDPSVIQADISPVFEPVIASLEAFANSAAVPADEPPGAAMMLTALVLSILVGGYRRVTRITFNT